MMERPPIEEILDRTTMVHIKNVCDYALDLEARLKEAEEALNTTGFHGTQSHGILTHFNEKALKGLGKEKG